MSYLQSWEAIAGSTDIQAEQQRYGWSDFYDFGIARLPKARSLFGTYRTKLLNACNGYLGVSVLFAEYTGLTTRSVIPFCRPVFGGARLLELRVHGTPDPRHLVQLRLPIIGFVRTSALSPQLGS